MTEYLIQSETIDNIADAIRAKTGEAGTMTPGQMPGKIAGISTKEDISWHQCPQAVRNYLDNVTYDPSDYSTSQIANYAPGTAVASNTKPIAETVSGDGHRNEIPNEETPFSSNTKAGTLTPLDQVRWINSHANNTRDIGGWVCDGGRIKYGLLYRGANLFANDRGLFVDELGIRQEVNLRHDDTKTASPLGDDVRYYKTPQSIEYTLSPASTWKSLLETIFDNARYGVPTFFHCYYGSDRTGTLACILEGILGVSQSDIDKDYELSSFYAGTSSPENKRARNESEWQSLISQINAFAGNTFRDKCVSFAASVGVSPAAINYFRDAMSSGTPAKVINGINTSLSHCTGNNSASYILAGQSYTNTITANTGYTLDGGSISVKMGGVDITSSAYSNGTISITTVTGDVDIVISAVEPMPAYTNQIPISIDTDGSRFGTNGIQINRRWGSTGTLSTDSNANTAGLIPVTTGDVVRLQDVGLFRIAMASASKNTGHRIAIFDTSRAYQDYIQPFTGSSYETKFATKFDNISTNADGEIIQMTAKFSGYFSISAANSASAAAIGSDHYLDTNSIITVNEEIV